MKNILYKNFSWNLFGSLIYAFTQYLLIIIIGRFGSSEILGIYSLGLALTAPIMMFTNLKLRTVQSTGYAKEFLFKDFAHTRIIGNIVFIILTILVAILLDYSISILLIILIIAISKIIESFSELFYGTLQYNERLDIVAKSYILRGLSSVIIFWILFIISYNLLISLLGIVFSWLFILYIYDIKKTRDFIESDSNLLNINYNSIKRIIIISLPLGLIALLGTLSVNIPRIIIESNLSFEELGHFSSVFYLTIILGKFVTSLGAAILPRLSKQFENNNYKQHFILTLKFSIIIVILSSILIFVSYIFGDEILTILYGSEFTHLGDFFVLVMFYGLFTYLKYSLKVSLESTRIFRPQMYVEAFNVFLTLILSLILIPNNGIYGAISALTMSSLLSVILLTLLYIKIVIDLKRRTLYK